MNNRQKAKTNIRFAGYMEIFGIILILIIFAIMINVDKHTDHPEPVYHWAIG